MCLRLEARPIGSYYQREFCTRIEPAPAFERRVLGYAFERKYHEYIRRQLAVQCYRG